MRSGTRATESPGAEKAIHPPRAVARLTGLSLHVLRAWESRHGAVVPARTAGGARRYTSAQVERLRRLAEAARDGHTIGTLATLTDAELERLVTTDGAGTSGVVSDLVSAALRLDRRRLANGLGLQLATRGPRDFARSVARPLLVRIGDLWERGEAMIAAEHLVTREVRSMLETAIRPTAADSSTVDVLMATPAGERHDLGLLIAAAGLDGLGVGVLILGADLPAKEIAKAQRATRAAAIALGLVALDPESARGEMASLRAAVRREVPIWVGGRSAGDLGIPGVEAVTSLDEFERRVQLLSPTERERNP